MSIIRADSIKNRAGDGAPDFPNGITVTGVVTATTLNQNVTGVSTFNGNIDVNGNADISGNLSVGGVLTYEDVKNVDAIGIITARDGIKMTGGSLYVGGNSNFTGSLTGTATTSTTVTVTDESSDTSCYPLFVTTNTGNLPPKVGTNLTFNSSSGQLTATSFAGSGSGITNINGSNITANSVSDGKISGMAASKLTGALPAIDGSNLTNVGGGLQSVQVFTSSGTWNRPSGITKVRIICTGGGAGGGGPTPSWNAGGGGGGGGTSIKLLDVTSIL